MIQKDHQLMKIGAGLLFHSEQRKRMQTMMESHTLLQRKRKQRVFFIIYQKYPIVIIPAFAITYSAVF